MKEKFKIVDSIEVCVRDKVGNIKSKHMINSGFLNRLLCRLGVKHNSVTKLGMQEVAKLILTDVGGTAFDYIGIGEGTTAATVNDATLESEVKRKAAVGSLNTTTQINDTAKWVVTFSSADSLSGNDAITEIGILNAASNGVLLLRQVYSPADNCNWDAGDTLEVTVKCQIKQGS
jgi:hypothetical protein